MSILITIVRFLIPRSQGSRCLARAWRDIDHGKVDSDVTAPIFVIERNGYITAYESASEACAALESIDVEEGEYAAAFDAEGRALALRVDSPTKRGRFLGLQWIELTPVVIEALEEQPSHQEELRSLLISALRIGGHPVGAALPLRDIVKSASKALGAGSSRQV